LKGWHCAAKGFQPPRGFPGHQLPQRPMDQRRLLLNTRGFAGRAQQIVIQVERGPHAHQYMRFTHARG
jgi:hypothetical protein